MKRLNQTNNFLGIKIKGRIISFHRRFFFWAKSIFQKSWKENPDFKIRQNIMVLWTLPAGDSTLKVFLPLSKDLVGYIIHVFQSLLSNHQNFYFWQMWLTQPIGLLPSFQKMMETLRNIYWRHHVQFHHFDEVYTIQHERNALKFLITILAEFYGFRDFRAEDSTLNLLLAPYFKSFSLHAMRASASNIFPPSRIWCCGTTINVATSILILLQAARDLLQDQIIKRLWVHYQTYGWSWMIHN